jgi:hypothetical protein
VFNGNRKVTAALACQIDEHHPQVVQHFGRRYQGQQPSRFPVCYRGHDQVPDVGEQTPHLQLLQGHHHGGEGEESGN